MEFLEAVREEVCTGMDAFDSIMELDAGLDADRTFAFSMFLMQILERLANRLQGFYAKLARYSIFQPDMERNPARARWSILRRKIRDGSFFVLTREVSMQPTPSYWIDGVDFEQVISQIEMNLKNTSLAGSHTMGLNEQHAARAMEMPNGAPAYEQHTQRNALQAMSTFMSSNKKAIRRLSKLPASMELQQLMQAYESRQGNHQPLPTPPSSRPISRSPSASTLSWRSLARGRSQTTNDSLQLLQRRNTDSSRPKASTKAATISALMTGMNSRTTSNTSPTAQAPDLHSRDRARSTNSFAVQKPAAAESMINSGTLGSASSGSDGVLSRPRNTAGSLRAFRLQASAVAGGIRMGSESLRT